MLTWGDEYPIHQTPEPIAYSGSDRNFYDRYFYNGYTADGSVFFACAFGVYPHLNVMDAAVSVLREGRQSSVFFFRPLAMERLDTRIGGLSIQVMEPLKRIRLTLEETEGLALDLSFEGRAFPVEEPRFTYRQGPRMLIDCTRMTQNGRWQGSLRVDGQEFTVTPDHWMGTRDRSWGVRPIGAPDPQPLLPMTMPQFYWIWTPLNFEDRSVYFHTNDDASGHGWNRSAKLVADGAGADGHQVMTASSAAIEYRPGTRRAAFCTISCDNPEGHRQVTLEPVQTFLMKGIGYGHPTRRHGARQGETLVIAREDFVPEDEPLDQPENLHIQAISKAVLTDETCGRHYGIGSFEQLFVGPHEPSGLTDLIGPAA